MNKLTIIPGGKKPYDPEQGIAIRSREITRLEKVVRAKDKRIAALECQVDVLTQERDAAQRDIDSAWAVELRQMAMQRLGIQADFIDDVCRLVIDRAEAAESRIAQLERERDDAGAERERAVSALHEMRMSFNRLADHHKRDHHQGDMPPDHEVEDGYFQGARVLAELRDLRLITVAEKRREAAEAQVAELRTALERYGTHRDACVAFPATAQDQIDERCSCGLSAIVANPLANSQPQTADLLLAVDAAIRRAPAEALARRTEDAPGCTSCGWNDEHSPQCPHYGRFPAPPS